MRREEDNARSTGLVDPGLLTSLGSLRVRAKQVVEGAIAGLHRSALTGVSVEFTEYKEYSAGDDIRHIDWKSFARTDRYFVKQFEDETNLRAYLLIDCSGSMLYGSEGGPTKHTYAAHLAAALAYLFVHQGDAVGLLTFSKEPGGYLPPGSRQSHLEDLFSLLENSASGGGTDLSAALMTLAERARPRSLAFLLSDLLDTSPAAMNAAKVLRQRRFEVILFHLVDPAELTLPFEGLTLFTGLEGEGGLVVDPDDIRDQYKKEIQGYFASVERECHHSDIEYRRVSTAMPMESVLLDFLFWHGRKR
ncbi:MAG: DUF58 domain-containing protein [Bradymonadales bacterium]|nr:DUF58 domain-containing protein [Bradymonadales bacterium]